MNTAKSLKLALVHREVSQTWLAVEMEIHRQQVNAWCNGQTIKPSTLEEICRLLDYEVSEFIALGED